MAPPTRPVAGAVIATAWGQYVHDHALLGLGHGAIAVSGSADQVDLTSGGVWSLIPFTGTDKWDPDGRHSTVTSTSRIGMSIPGLWIVYAKLVFAAAVDDHLDYAGISYGSGLGSQPLEKDWRSQTRVQLEDNHHMFGPWFVVSVGGGGSAVELWAASNHGSGSEAVNATAGFGEFSAFCLQPDI